MYIEYKATMSTCVSNFRGKMIAFGVMQTKADFMAIFKASFL